MRKKKKNVYVVEKETKEEKIENYVTKEKKELPNPLQGVNFWLLCAACALLIVMGIWIILDNSLGTKLVVGFTGFVIVVFGLVRFVPLIRTQKKGVSKMVIALEILIDLAIGAFLFYGAFRHQAGQDDTLSIITRDYYRYFLGAVLYLKGVFYFITTALLGEVTNKKEFWLHIVIMTLGVVVFALNIDASSLALFIAVIALLAGIAAGGAAGGSYFNYRKRVVLPKKKEKKAEETEEENEEENANILPSDSDDKRPYVN